MVSLGLYSMSPKDIKNSNKKHQMLEKTNKHKKTLIIPPVVVLQKSLDYLYC